MIVPIFNRDQRVVILGAVTAFEIAGHIVADRYVFGAVIRKIEHDIDEIISVVSFVVGTLSAYRL
jgi:hypothetical protein